MPAPRANLGSSWVSETDIRNTLSRIRTTGLKHSEILRRINMEVARHRDSLTNTLQGVDGGDHLSVINKSVAGKRSELIRASEESRLLLTRELESFRRTIRSAETHYRSPVQMLMRDTLGSEERSRYMRQIAQSGPAELASLAEFAAANKNKNLAAALCSRVSDMPRAERPFIVSDLADVICGELFRELSQAMIEAERHVLQALEEEAVASTGKGNPQRKLEIAIMKKREQEVGAYAPEAEDDDSNWDDRETEAGNHVSSLSRIEAGLRKRRGMSQPSEIGEASA